MLDFQIGMRQLLVPFLKMGHCWPWEVCTCCDGEIVQDLCFKLCLLEEAAGSILPQVT